MPTYKEAKEIFFANLNDCRKFLADGDWHTHKEMADALGVPAGTLNGRLEKLISCMAVERKRFLSSPPVYKYKSISDLPLEAIIKERKRVKITSPYELVMRKIEMIPISGCWISKGALDANGYIIVHENGANSKKVRGHRVMYEYYFGPIPKGLCVMHRCDIPCCCNPHHLDLGTYKQNSEDMAKKSRSAHGVKNPWAKLNPDKVREIRVLLKTENMSSIARKFGVAPWTIKYIKDGITWVRVKDE